MIGLENFQLKIKKEVPFKFKIRYAETKDIENMVPIINESYLVETFKTKKRTNVEDLKEEFKNNSFILIEGSSNDKDFIVASVEVNIKGKGLYFGMLAVDKIYQGYGFGFAMIELIKDITKEMKLEYVELWVVHVRKELIQYYEKLGFEKIGTEEWPKHLLDEINQEVHFEIMKYFIK